MTFYCPSCGNALDASSTFCTRCGAKVPHEFVDSVLASVRGGEADAIKTDTPEEKIAEPEMKADTPPETKDDMPLETKDDTPPETKDDMPPENKDDMPPEAKDDTPPETKDDTPPEAKDDTPPETEETPAEAEEKPAGDTLAAAAASAVAAAPYAYVAPEAAQSAEEAANATPYLAFAPADAAAAQPQSAEEAANATPYLAFAPADAAAAQPQSAEAQPQSAEGQAAAPAVRRGRPRAWAVVSVILSVILALYLMSALCGAATLALLRRTLSSDSIARAFASVQDELADGDFADGKSLAELLSLYVGEKDVTQDDMQFVLDNSDFVAFLGEKLCVLSDQLFTTGGSRANITAEEIADAVCTKKVTDKLGWTRACVAERLEQIFDFDTFSVDGLCASVGVNADMVRLAVSVKAVIGLLGAAALLAGLILVLGIRSRGVGCLINAIAFALCGLSFMGYALPASGSASAYYGFYGGAYALAAALARSAAPAALVAGGAMLAFSAAFFIFFAIRRSHTKPDKAA